MFNRAYLIAMHLDDLTMDISVGPNVNLVYKISYLKKIQDYMYFRTKGGSPTKSL